MTIEEIKAAVEKSPDLKGQILSSFKDELPKLGESLGLIVRTKEQDESWLQAQLNVKLPGEVDKLAKAKVDSMYAEAMNAIDAKVKDITGIEKNPGEKTTDYASRAISEKGKGGGGVNADKVRELEQMIEKLKGDHASERQKLQGELFQKDIDFQLNSFLDSSNIAVPPHLKTDEEKQGFINQQKALIRSGFLNTYQPKKDDAGNIVFYEGDKPIMSTTDGKPKSAADIMKEKFGAWFAPKEHKQGGAGTGGQGGAKPEGGFKSKDDIHKYLAANGIAAGSSEYLNKLSELAAESKIDI